jgi:hypothetical protein
MSVVASEISASAGISNNRFSSFDFVSTSSPHDEYELIQRIGSGTYGDVYKVSLDLSRKQNINIFILLRQDIFQQHQCERLK